MQLCKRTRAQGACTEAKPVNPLGGQAGQPATVASRIVNNRAACLHALSANSLHVSASAELLGQTDVRSLS